MTQKTPKDVRHELYDFIQREIGVVTPADMQTIKGYLSEYVKIYNDGMLEQLNTVNDKYKKLKGFYNEELNRIRKEKKMDYFNYNFIQR